MKSTTDHAPVGSSTAGVKQTFGFASQLMAFEQRMLFDGALALTVADTSHDQFNDGSDSATTDEIGRAHV